MSSLTKNADAGHFGFTQDQLPASDHGFLDLKSWFSGSAVTPAGGVVGADANANTTAATAPLPSRAHLPLELEIGSGKGSFLVKQAQAAPDVNYIGLEYARAFWLYTADRVRRHGLENVRVVHAEAGMFVRCFVPDACLRQVHVYFPDPWPKKRHHKRRSIQAPFLKQLHRVLEPAGRIRLATDHADYFAWMEEHAALVADLFDRLPFESPEAAGEGELVGTNFERKYRREGRPFYSMVLRKKC